MTSFDMLEKDIDEFLIIIEESINPL